MWVWVWVWFRVLVVAAGAEKNIKNEMQTGQKKIKIEEIRKEQTREINYLHFISINIKFNIIFIYE